MDGWIVPKEESLYSQTSICILADYEYKLEKRNKKRKRKNVWENGPKGSSSAPWPLSHNTLSDILWRSVIDGPVCALPFSKFSQRFSFIYFYPYCQSKTPTKGWFLSIFYPLTKERCDKNIVTIFRRRLCRSFSLVHAESLDCKRKNELSLQKSLEPQLQWSSTWLSNLLQMHSYGYVHIELLYKFLLLGYREIDR